MKPMTVIYVNNISHFRLSVCFCQIKTIVVFWCALRFLLFEKNSFSERYHWALIVIRRLFKIIFFIASIFLSVVDVFKRTGRASSLTSSRPCLNRLYRVRHLTFFFQLVLISWMVTLSSCLFWQIISFILPPNEYCCVYAWATLENIATDRLTEDADFGKKKSCFQMKLILILAGI